MNKLILIFLFALVSAWPKACCAQESSELRRYLETEIPAMESVAGSLPVPGVRGAELPGMELSSIDYTVSPYANIGIGLELSISPELDLVFTPPEER